MEATIVLLQVILMVALIGFPIAVFCAFAWESEHWSKGEFITTFLVCVFIFIAGVSLLKHIETLQASIGAI